jgi:hypothetical protein
VGVAQAIGAGGFQRAIEVAQGWYGIGFHREAAFVCLRGFGFLMRLAL